MFISLLSKMSIAILIFARNGTKIDYIFRLTTWSMSILSQIVGNAWFCINQERFWRRNISLLSHSAYYSLVRNDDHESSSGYHSKCKCDWEYLKLETIIIAIAIAIKILFALSVFTHSLQGVDKEQWKCFRMSLTWNHCDRKDGFSVTACQVCRQFSA